MTSLARRRREHAIAHAEGHADPMVQEAVRALLGEIVVLRAMLGDGPPTLTLSRRRWVARMMAAFVLTAGLTLGAWWATHAEAPVAFRQGMVQGYQDATATPRPAPVESVSTSVQRPTLQHARVATR
jgi:hypothetical protein